MAILLFTAAFIATLAHDLCSHLIGLYNNHTFYRNNNVGERITAQQIRVCDVCSKYRNSVARKVILNFKMADIRKPNPKFPPTRLLKAGYKDIVPNSCHDEEVTKSLNEVVHSAYFTTNTSAKPNFTIHPSEIQGSALSRRTEKLKAILEQQISELSQSIQLQEKVIEKSLPNIRTLIRVSKIEPSLTAVTLNYCTLATPTLSRVRRCGVVQCCRCSQRALPFTRFCTKRKPSLCCLYRNYIIILDYI